MKLEDARDNYYALSGKLSDIVRALGFAGIALIWIFKADQAAGRFQIPRELFLPATLIFVGLGFDLMHYVSGAAAWGIFNRWKERQGTGPQDEFTAPPWINWPAIFFFWTKTVVMVAAYVSL